MGSPTAPARALLSIHFVVVGGSIAGLATALALARAGHRVTVLEKRAEDAPHPAGGFRIVPNGSKLFARWGLEKQLADVSVDSRMIHMYTYAQGEYLGYSAWHEDMLREGGGQCLDASYDSIRALLLTAARDNGAVVRFDAPVTALDQKLPSVTLADGEVIEGDVIVGADGSRGIMRNAVFKSKEQVKETGLALFSMTVPIECVDADPLLRDLLVDNAIGYWLGDGRLAHGFPVRPSGIYALHLYLPRHDLGNITIPDHWGKPAVDLAELAAAVRNAEPRLQSLVTKASAASVVAYQTFQPFEDDEDWILSTVPGVLLGDAAHPAIPASIQACPAALEDAAVFAKLFSHLRRREQIPSFLSAFTSLRAERVRRMQEADAQLFQYSLMPYDDSGLAQIRDDSFRALTKAGRMVLGQADGDAASNAQWYGTLMTWVYDAEDDADDWWMKWGVIEERGRENPQALDFDLAASITDVSASTKITTKNSSTGSSKTS